MHRGPDAIICVWKRAAQLRSVVEQDLRPLGLSFPLWWVLYTTDCLIEEAEDAVSERDVCKRTLLDKNTVSYLMRKLAERALVDIGPSYPGPGYRIFVSEAGEALLERARNRFEHYELSSIP